MDLNLTNLKDLDYILEIAASVPINGEWLQRISRYRQLIHTEIYRLGAEPALPSATQWRAEFRQFTHDLHYFEQLIGILHTEDLLRLQRRAELANNPRLAEILGEEIIERQAIEAGFRDAQKS